MLGGLVMNTFNTFDITMVEEDDRWIKARSAEMVRVTGRHVHNSGWRMDVELFHSNPGCCEDGPQVGEHMHLSAQAVVLQSARYGKPAPRVTHEARPYDRLMIAGEPWLIVPCRFRDPLLFQLATLPDSDMWPWPMVKPPTS